MSKRMPVLLLYVLLGGIVYSNTPGVPFHFDDVTAIVDNPAVRDVTDWRAILNAFNTRFLLGLSFAINYALDGYDVRGYHLFNIAVHILNAWAVWAFVRALFRTRVMAASRIAPRAGWIAFAAGLIFLVHPVQTGAVTYIWQRGTSLAALFYLCGLNAYLRARLGSSPVLYAAAWCALLAGLLTKEITVVFPFTLLGLEFFFLREKKHFPRRVLVTLLPFFLALWIIPLLLLRETPVTMDLMEFQRGKVVSANPWERLTGLLRTSNTTLQELPRWNYTLAQLNSLRTYMRLLVWPVNQNVDYQYTLPSRLTETGTLFSLLLAALVAAGGIVCGRHAPILAFAVFWFFLHLMLESFVMVVPDLVFEHRLYLPSVGFALLTAAGAAYLLSDRQRTLALVAITLVLAGAAWRRNLVWQTYESLWTDAVKKSPDKCRPYHNLSVAYYRKGDWQEAVRHGTYAIRLDEKYVNAYHGVAFAYGKMGNLRAMLRYALKPVQLEPDKPGHYVNAAIALGEAGLFKKSLAYCLKALELDPGHLGALDQIGFVLWRQGDVDGAIDALQQVLRKEPGHFKACAKLGMIYREEKGELDEAEKYFKRARQARPRHPDPLLDLGRVYDLRGDLKTAGAYYQKALKLNPNHVRTHQALAEFYKKTGETEKARLHAERIPPSLSRFDKGGGSGMAMSEISAEVRIKKN